MNKLKPTSKVTPGFFRTIATVLAIVLAVYAGLSLFGAATAMEIPRLPLKSSPTAVGLTYEDVAFPSRDGEVTLRGWFIPAGGDRAIIIVHGGFQNRVDEVVGTLALARDLAQEGYNLLLFDLRGRGESEGRGHSLSHTEPDIGGALDYLKGRGYPAGRSP